MNHEEKAFRSTREPLLQQRQAAAPTTTHQVAMIQRYRRPILAALLMVAFLVLGWTRWLKSPMEEPSILRDARLLSIRKIPLEAHIMSKCPDAQDCLRDLVLPAMEKVSDKVDFKLSYIGTPTHDDDGVACKHGPSECLGNIVELCAATLYPSPKTYLGFTMCLTNQYEHIPERNLIEDCALEHGLDFDKINGCVSSDDGYGVNLLRDSVERSTKAGVTMSCTIRLDEKTRCIRDGGEWKDCEGGSEVGDLVRDIEMRYGAKDGSL
ncbi:MAG: hypothetical protein M4579_003409 [Chaenotheca gracillima]|nr:MAG: hypothetical protein M4579_003409 [Chaenotheca gracillima]